MAGRVRVAHRVRVPTAVGHLEDHPRQLNAALNVDGVDVLKYVVKT